MAQVLTKKDIAILNAILNKQNKEIENLRSKGKPPYSSDINLCGAPGLVPLYDEIYKSVKANNNILALAGIRIFLEEFISILWVASEVRAQQLSGKLGGLNKDWERIMKFHDEKHREIELEKVSFTEIYKALADKNVLSPKEIKEIKIIRKCVGNIFIHSKKMMLLEKLIKAGLFTPEIPILRLNKKTKKVEKVIFGTSHSMIRPSAFKRLAKFFASPLLKYIFDLTNRKKGLFGPIRGNRK